MKTFLLGIVLCGMLAFAPPARGQVYDPYYNYDYYWELQYRQYQQYLHYQNYLEWQTYLSRLPYLDPYYQLHLIHYQLYLAPYNPYGTYLPCCSLAGFTRLAPRSSWIPFGTGR